MVAGRQVPDQPSTRRRVCPSVTSSTREPLVSTPEGRSTLCAAVVRARLERQTAAVVSHLERCGDGAGRAELHVCDRPPGRARRHRELRGRCPILERRDGGQRGAEGEEGQPQATDEHLGPRATSPARRRGGRDRVEPVSVGARAQRGRRAQPITFDSQSNCFQELGDVVETAGLGGQLGEGLSPAVRLVGVLGHQLGLVADALCHELDEVAGLSCP